MKPLFLVRFLFIPAVFGACVQPAPHVKVSLKLEPAPVVEPPMPLAPDADLKDIKFMVGNTVSTAGIVYGQELSGDSTLVYLGRAKPNQLLTVILQADARAGWSNKDGKLLYVSGGVSKHNGKVQMLIRDRDHYGLKPLYDKPHH
jgi:hypothetical protein